MRAPFKPHIAYPGPGIAIEAEAARAGDRLSVSYRVSGKVAAVRWPAPANPGRADELWRHTCFEAFVAPTEGAAYCEINLSPSGQWATYRFEGYRLAMAAAEAEVSPFSPELKGASELLLTAEVDLSQVGWLAGATWRLGLTAVIEDEN